MAVKDLFRNFLSKNEGDIFFRVDADSFGLNFILPADEFKRCQKMEANEWLQNQFLFLKMLEEEGMAGSFPNGFSVLSDNIVRLPEAKELFDLPFSFPGKFSTYVENQTTQSSFKVKLRLEYPDGQNTIHYEIKGPFLKVGESETYLPSAEQWAVLTSVKEHQELDVAERSEYQNLLLINKLQQAKNNGTEIDLSHFNDLKIVNPETVSVSIREINSGDAVLNPVFGIDASIEKVEQRLGQLTGHETAQSFRVGDEIVLLDEKKLKAAREIINNRKIPKSQVKEFLKTPSAFLNASIVDLDTGFSMRVKGAVRFQHAYFGETDESGLDWFVGRGKGSKCVDCNDLDKIIKDPETLELFRKKLETAQKHNAQEMSFADQTVDISESEKIKETLKMIEMQLLGKTLDSPEKIAADQAEDDEKKQPSEKDETVVVDIDTNDEILSFGSELIAQKMQEVSYRGKLHTEEYKREPFRHQEEGIRWLLGLALSEFTETGNEKDKIHGGVMADDMGLGKTYMSLAGVYEFYKHLEEKGQKKRPVLVVAPLSLLETWKEELDLTFKNCPFNDVVILQSNAELKRFKVKGASVETKQANSDIPLNEENAIKYALKIGSHYVTDRLDIYQRLILTTYQTLRDYQFSLCRIDWSFVIFDEAQNIKNPNTLQTRAAKGLKAQFKLVATGTPVENHLGDFWCLFDTAQPGHLGAYQEFRSKYISPIEKAPSDKVADVRAVLGRKLREDVGSLMIRRVKEDQLDGLPKKHIYVGTRHEGMNSWNYLEALSSVMEGKQLTIYDASVNGVISAQAEKGKDNLVLKGLHQLRDISLHHDLVDGGCLNLPETKSNAKLYVYSSAKLETVFTILEEVKNREEKVILFVINKRLQRFLKIACHRLFGEDVEIINGETPAVVKGANKRTRKSIVDEFQLRPDFGVIIMSPIAAGVGLTVTGANNVIHVERHWNPAKEAQATDRVYRIGAKKDVNIYIPILHHPEVTSFDENLHKLLSKKTNLKDAVVTPEEVDLTKTNIFISSGNEDRFLEGTDLKNLPWEHFEALVAELYSSIYQATTYMTAVSNDRGCDVVVLSESFGNMLIQCKHTINKILSGEGPVRELLAAPSFYKEKVGKEFTHSIVITNALKFSKPTQEAARRENISLVGYKDLKKMLESSELTYSDLFKRLNKKRLS